MGSDEPSDSLKDFENYLKNIYINQFKNPSYNYYEKGYIINLENYEKIKDINQTPPSPNGMKNISKIDQIPFKTSSFLINMIYNGNEYIIINKRLWKNICVEGKENESPINYYIQNNYLVLKLDKDLFFSINNRNIIRKEDYFLINNSNYKSNFDEIEKIYGSIKKYDEFENKFLNDLKSPVKISNSGYIVDNDWFEEWKLYTNYQSIKNNYLEKNEQKIKNELILFNEKNKNNKKLEEIKMIDFNNKIDLETYLKSNSAVLLDKNFISEFHPNPNSLKKINYYFL